MKRVVFLVLVAVFALAISLDTTVSAGDKVTVCHVQDKSTGAGQIMDVTYVSAPGHLGHGDSLTTGTTGSPCYAR